MNTFCMYRVIEMIYPIYWTTATRFWSIPFSNVTKNAYRVAMMSVCIGHIHGYTCFPCVNVRNILVVLFHYVTIELPIWEEILLFCRWLRTVSPDIDACCVLAQLLVVMNRIWQWKKQLKTLNRAYMFVTKWSLIYSPVAHFYYNDNSASTFMLFYEVSIAIIPY